VRGFTIVELLVTVSVIMIMAAAAVPLVQSTLARMRLRNAATSVSGIIQSTRYQAISNGYQYKLVFDKTGRTYQVSNDPSSSGTFTNVGSAVPYTGSTVDLAANTTVVFSPSGKVSFTSGSSPLVLTFNGNTGTITVSPYGNVNVTYTP
jgi:type IV fimbrial biogenesis protein FimT